VAVQDSAAAAAVGGKPRAPWCSAPAVVSKRQYRLFRVEIVRFTARHVSAPRRVAAAVVVAAEVVAAEAVVVVVAAEVVAAEAATSQN
jgi:hypothetical protein